MLDLGCALGVATLPALSAGARVVATDISLSHLEALASSVRDHSRLRMMHARFPGEMHLCESSLDTALLSNVLHFLNAEEIALGLRNLFGWMKPNGIVHVLVSSPYIAYLRPAIQGVEARSRSGDQWPGQIANVHEICQPELIASLPPFLHVFTRESLSRAFWRAGFIVSDCAMFRRRDIPAAARLDGRENVRLVARKPHDAVIGPQTPSGPMIADDVRTLARVRQLRLDSWAADGVFVSHKSLLADDGHDDHALHWIVEDETEMVIASARMCVHRRLTECPDAQDLGALKDAGGPYACLNRLVVAPHARRQGLARALDQARLRAAEAMQCRVVTAVADRKRAVALERAGFRRVAIVPRRVAVPLAGQVLVRDVT